MCDIGRFDYHWIEGDSRLTAPLVREDGGHHQSTTWDGALKALAERAPRGAVGTDVPDVGARIERGDLPDRAARGRDRRQLEGDGEEAAGGHEVQGPTVDAPNVNGARDLGLPVGDGVPDLAALRQRVEPARCARSMSSTGPGRLDRRCSWAVAARQSGKYRC
jgi:hypothetical protein